MASTTQRNKLVRRLSSGKNLTVTEAVLRYRIKNLSARIAELRDEGFTIYTNKVRVKGGKNAGKRVTAYRLHVSETPKHLIKSV